MVKSIKTDIQSGDGKFIASGGVCFIQPARDSSKGAGDCEGGSRSKASEVDELQAWPAHTMEALGAAGLLGLHVPQRLGGLGHGLVGLIAVTEQLGQACSSSSMCFGMHSVGTAVMAAKATPYHEDNYLTPIARGEHVTTLALSESGSGVHFYLPET